MTSFTRSSGDLSADRRYAYAEGCRAEGDHRAAAELFQQVLELTPDWAPAWFGLGEARAALGERDEATAAFEKALSLQDEDVLGAAAALAALGTREAPPSLSPGYVRTLFDQYAPKFETHLVDILHYRGPGLIASALAGLRRAPFRRLLDLGCGTGLMAAAMADRAAEIVGVDLSPNMAARARASGLYSALATGDLVEFLRGQPAASADLAIAADVLIYLGDLGPLFAGIRRVLEPGGLFAFSVQTPAEHDPDPAPFTIGTDRRYAHRRDYLHALASEHGFHIRHESPDWVRRDQGRPVPGLVLVLERT